MTVHTTPRNNLLEGRRVETEIATLAQMSDADMGVLCQGGTKRVVLRQAVSLSLSDTDTEQVTLGFLSALKAATARGLSIDWSLDGVPDIPSWHLNHLWPPSADGTPIVTFWRKTYRFGSCYWRNGNSFAEIIDKRIAEDQKQHIVDEQPMLSIFREAAVPTSLADLPAGHEAALETLQQAGIVTTGPSLCLALPYRVVQWPIPYRSI